MDRKYMSIHEYITRAISLMMLGINRVDHEQKEYKAITYRVGDIIRIDISPGQGFTSYYTNIDPDPGKDG